MPILIYDDVQDILWRCEACDINMHKLHPVSELLRFLLFFKLIKKTIYLLCISVRFCVSVILHVNTIMFCL